MLRYLLLGLAVGLAACASHQGRDNTSVDIPQTRPNETTIHVYTPGGWPEALKATVIRPEGEGPHPAVLLIHGGGWQRGAPRSMNGVARRLSRKGLITVNVQYRFAPEHPFPAALHDVQQAMHWLHENAEKLELDPARIAVLGFSSGAHLGTLMAAVAGQENELNEPHGGQKTRPVAVVAGGTPTDLREWPQGRYIEDFLGGKRDDNIGTYEQASPIVHIHSDMPPVFLFHGNRDRIVKPVHAHAMKEALDELGVQSELYISHYRGHFSSFIFRRGAMKEATRFLHQQFESQRDRSHEAP